MKRHTLTQYQLTLSVPPRDGLSVAATSRLPNDSKTPAQQMASTWANNNTTSCAVVVGFSLGCMYDAITVANVAI